MALRCAKQTEHTSSDWLEQAYVSLEASAVMLFRRRGIVSIPLIRSELCKTVVTCSRLELNVSVSVLRTSTLVVLAEIVSAGAPIWNGCTWLQVAFFGKL